MSKHTVGMDALDVVLTLHGPGTTLPVGEDASPVPDGKAALVIETGGDAVVVTGTLQQLRSLVQDGLSLPIPAGAPLYDEQP